MNHTSIVITYQYKLILLEMVTQVGSAKRFKERSISEVEVEQQIEG